MKRSCTRPTCSTLSRAAVLLLLSATAAVSADGKTDGETAGCWYAVYACSKSESIDGPGFTVSTDTYAGFDQGQYCNIGGPFDTREDAQTQIARFGGEVRRSC